MKTALLFLSLGSIALQSQAMILTSKDIQEGSRMTNNFEFNGFGCNGKNLSPALAWSKAPKGTKSFAITAFDPDAPTNSGFWHWVAIDIPASVTQIPRGGSKKLTFGKEMKNDYGSIGYGGACPPKGKGMHRYQFTLWALPVEKLAIQKDTSNAVIGFILNSSALDKKTLTSTYVID